jgi:hypothetical protein
MDENDFLRYLSEVEKKISNSILYELPKIRFGIAAKFLKNKYLSEIELGRNEQSKNEKIAVITSGAKLHSLFFDRIDCQAIMDGTASSIPWEYVNRYMTYETCLFSFFNNIFSIIIEDPNFEDLRQQFNFDQIAKYLLGESQKIGLFGNEHCQFFADERSMLKKQSESINALYDTNAIPVYSSNEEFVNDFGAGSYVVTQRVIDKLEIADNDQLEWSQVKQFKDDRDMRNKYAQFLDFLKSKWSGNNIDYYSYEIESKYYEYNESLKKHGIKTRIGVFKDLFSGKFILPTSMATIASSVTSPELTPILIGLFTVGKLSLSLFEYKLNLRSIDKPDKSIAWIYEIKKKVKQ